MMRRKRREETEVIEARKGRNGVKFVDGDTISPSVSLSGMERINRVFFATFFATQMPILRTSHTSSVAGHASMLLDKASVLFEQWSYQNS